MKKISVVSIPVSDQEVSKAFYLKLGFHILIEAPMGNGQTWVQLGLEGAETSISLVTWFPKMKPGCVDGLVLKVENIVTEIEELSQKGITAGKLDETPWGKFAEVIDPDGNSMILHQE